MSEKKGLAEVEPAPTSFCDNCGRYHAKPGCLALPDPFAVRRHHARVEAAAMDVIEATEWKGKP